MANAKLTEAAHGIYVIAATPFTDSVALDLDSTDRLMDFYLDTGVHGVTILGVMGEAPKLSAAEQTTFMQRALQRIGARVPVIVGVSNPGLDNLSALAQDAMANGAAGVMVAPVAGLKTDDQVYAYLANVLNRLGPDIPVCLQDYPPVTMVHMSVTTINRLIDDFPQLVMFKHEDAPGLRKLQSVVPECRSRSASGQYPDREWRHTYSARMAARWRWSDDWVCVSGYVGGDVSALSRRRCRCDGRSL